MKIYKSENNKIMNVGVSSGVLKEITTLPLNKSFSYFYKNNKGEIILKTIKCIRQRKIKL